MTTRQTITLFVILGVTALLIAYDVVVKALWGDDPTISVVMLTLGHQHPVIPFALGVLFGHFFASQKAEGKWQP